MIVTLISPDEISTISLPERISGRYWIFGRENNGQTVAVADIEGIQDQWYIHGSPDLDLLDGNGNPVDSLPISTDKQVLNAKYRKTGTVARLYVEPSTNDRKSFRKYCVREKCRLNIGRGDDNQIVFNNRYVSSSHACLIWDDKGWSITDTQSSNGTFLNERRIATKALTPGDMIYIMGLKIIVGNGFFAINNPDHAVTIHTNTIAEMEVQTSNNNLPEYYEEPSPEVFLSSPRVRRSIIRRTVVVDEPPTIQQAETVPLALLLGPALTMGMTAVVMAAVAVINLRNGTSTLLTSLPTIVMSFSMLCGTLLWPLLTKRSEKKKRAKKEAERQNKYQEYLNDIRNQIFSFGEEQRTILLENCPSVRECVGWITRRNSRLWERTVGQDDFLNIRLGLGSVPLAIDIQYPERHFSLESDPLQNEVRRLEATPLILKDAPITCSILNTPLVGVIGDEAERFLQGLILQIAALHNYNQVRLVFFVDEANKANWDCFRFLPHVWDEHSEMRYFAVGPDEEQAISLHLEGILSDRRNVRSKDSELSSPHYVLVATTSQIANRIGLFSEITSMESNLGISGITTGCQLIDLPQECSVVIDLAKGESSVYNKNDLNGTRSQFDPEMLSSIEPYHLCNVLGNLIMYSRSEQYVLPNLFTFLEMYGVGKVEHLNALKRWQENSPINSLKAPIGVGMNGTLLCLDLHEKAHGPHGLVAGMTGSGKSEFIITYLLSLALNYHPDEVSFILIDYKGGGLAGAFEDARYGIHLPHLAGTITNLDGASVNRALLSLQSELRRRQTIFNTAKKISGDGTMDIYKYQKMYRSGMVKEPVPHLLVVSDEFAELKAQQPEFMSQLISAARIGRSLGVHLILATQKPTGVVDDQIWSNSRFRICLKVQERADSVEMLKRPDAAELKDTGRFYLQVGFNELFELGQTAWCGAPYLPVDRMEKKRDDRVEVIDHLGRVLLEARPKAKETTSTTSQAVAIVKYLASLAESEHISTRPLWLPPIPARIFLDDLIRKYQWEPAELELEPVIGEYDDPFNQAQGLLTIPLSREGNTLIYGVAGGGKTTLLNTMLVNLLCTYDARRLNVYIVDMGEETLRVFADAPQVGDVLLTSDGEKIANLFKMLREEIAARKKKFTEGNGSYFSYCSCTKDILPQILVVLRNYSGFLEQFEQLDEQLIQITRECSKYGIYFVVTANAANTIRYRVAQNFANVYALQLNDASDYIGLFSGTGGIYPSKVKGRGIFKKDRVYEFQSAYFAQDSSQQALRKFVEGLNRQTADHAHPVPTLPERVVSSFFRSEFLPAAIPVGIEKATLHVSTWNLDKAVISLILSQNIDELSATTQGIIEQLSRLDGTVTVLDGATLVDESDLMNCVYLKSGFSNRIEALFNEMVRRNNTYKLAEKENRKSEVYSPEYYVITGIQSIYADLAEDTKDKFNTLLEKAELHFHIRFILCSTTKELAEFVGTNWYKRHVTGSDGIWVGNGISDQYILKLGRLTNALYSEILPPFGYTVKRGKATLVKLIVGEHSEEDAE